MPKPRVTEPVPEEILRGLASTDIPSELKLDLLTSARERGPQASMQLDEFLLRDASRLRAALTEAGETQVKLQALVEKLTAPPMLPAIVIATDGSTVLVAQGSSRRVVHLAADSEEGIHDLESGDEVLLSSSANVIVAKSPYATYCGGETAVFDRFLGSRLVLKSRDEDIVVDPVGPAAREEWKPGDLARWERSLYVATERIPRSHGSGLWIVDTPSESFDDVGGLDSAIAEIKITLRLGLERPDIASKYKLRRACCILLYGPPGTGKTLLARATANWLAARSGDGTPRFIHVRPGEFGSMWYGETERKWRECFRVAREAADREPDVPVVVFLDEFDSVGAKRGRSTSSVDDRLVCTIAEEIDGFEGRRNVCVIAATNRPESLDPAFTRPGGRFGDVAIPVPRPNRDAARQILARHLSADVPLAVPGLSGERARDALVDAVLSKLYAPNAAGEIARISFRDASVRTVYPSDLVSGAALAKIARSAIQAAAVRELSGDGDGVGREDILTATEQELERAASLLRASNVRDYLAGIPEDADIAGVALVKKQVRRAHTYLRAI